MTIRFIILIMTISLFESHYFTPLESFPEISSLGPLGMMMGIKCPKGHILHPTDFKSRMIGMNA